MDLWIRSQNKEALLKVNNGLMYWEDKDIDKGKCIVIKETSTNIVVVGAYETKERALEILNTIQNILQPVVYIHEPKIDYNDLASSITGQFVVQSSQNVETELKQAGQFVYEMPEE